MVDSDSHHLLLPSVIHNYCRPRLQATLVFFFFNDTATTEIYTLSLHDALPISLARHQSGSRASGRYWSCRREIPWYRSWPLCLPGRSEEHTSELQSRLHLVCRLLLEKKNADPGTRIALRTSTVTLARSNHGRLR